MSLHANDNGYYNSKSDEYSCHDYPCYSGFHCPEELPASIPDDHFCSPFPCPDKIPTQRYSSPTSLFSPLKLAKLKSSIQTVNQLLTTLHHHIHPKDFPVFRLQLRSLLGVTMQIILSCKRQKKQESVMGCLTDVGQDFLILKTKKQSIWVPFTRVHLVLSKKWEIKNIIKHHRELDPIDPCLRRELVLNFGPTVANHPILFHIFFGIHFQFIYLSFE
ncbi:hypothetical protein [Thermoflavimicrobium daqui]|uniref:Uncharacterized protein n=1 Tax=Thermoflavimicrobium daqui TaxID=2137476 RepID=A0A364K402_9BACL|nr:hypothetical protein [Thermoflavimicrobium daqui]RAL24067.1 hypothetical protein DL897_10240 [Thermoflavimicrobium daqui]